MKKKVKASKDIGKTEVLKNIGIEASKDMGIGAIGSPDIVFARKFRWTLAGDNLPSDFCKSVFFNYAEKLIYFEYHNIKHQDQGFHAIVWAESIQNKHLPNETLVLTTYDGRGKALYKQVFKGLSIIGNTSDFDYESSEDSCQKVTVKYKYCHTELIACSNNTINNYEWKLYFEEQDRVTAQEVVLLIDKPRVDIEEVKIGHLNSNLWLPGKAKWQPLKIVATGEIRSYIGKTVIDQSKNITAVLTFFDNGKEVEKWRLEDAWIRNVNFDDKECEFILKFRSVKYEKKELVS